MHPALLPIDQITSVATAFTGVDVLACSHVSLPVPVPGPEGLRVLFMHCAVRTMGREDPGSDLSEPRFISAVDAETGQLLELKPFDPVAWRLPVRPGWSRVARPTRDGDKTWRAQVERFNHAFDRAMGLFAGGRRPVAQHDRQLMTTLHSSFRELAEPPLLDAYHAVGRVFFAWLHRASQ